MTAGGKLTWIAQPHGCGREDEGRKSTPAPKRAPRPPSSKGIASRSSSKRRPSRSFAVGWSTSSATAWRRASPRTGPTSIRSPRKQGFPTDFYFQCFFRVDQNPENFAIECRDKAVETIRSITAKPVVAYKILGAARLPPEEAFAYAFKHIAAKDGVCVGIFNKDKPGMLADDVKLMRRMTKS